MRTRHRSEPETSDATKKAAADVRTLASEWLIRRDAGLDEAGRGELAAWLAADPRHREMFAGLERMWAAFERAEQAGIAETIVTRLRVRARKRGSRRRTVAAVSGALGLVLGVALWAKREAHEIEPLASAAVAVDSVRKLPDGSIVELNVDAAIAVEYEAAARRVRLLRGEAHFHVEKDAQRPFLVEAGPVAVRAVGTAFTVQLSASRVEVIVTEGKVAVNREVGGANAGADASPDATTFVGSLNRLVVELAAAESVAPEVVALSETELAERLAWRTSRLEFSGMELEQAVGLMNRHNRMQIVLEGDGIARLRITGNVRTDNPEGFVRIIEATFGLVAERRSESDIVLRRAGSVQAR